MYLHVDAARGLGGVGAKAARGAGQCADSRCQQSEANKQRSQYRYRSPRAPTSSADLP
jgi:hypothetical protein